MVNIDELTCPACSSNRPSGKLKQISQNTLLCVLCKRTFPIVNQIPILIKKPEKHILKMGERIKKDPGWFSKSQIDSYDHGPYKDHLNRRKAYVTQIIEKHLAATKESNSRIIDLGCGDGQNLRWLSNFTSATIYGSDYSLVRLNRAQFVSPITSLVLMNLIRPVFHLNFFDVIFCNHVLEHLNNLQIVKEAFQKMNQMLKHTGVLIVGVPNEGAKWWKLAYELEPNLIKISDHKQFFTMDSISELAKESGFEITEQKYMGYCLPHFSADAIFKQAITGIDDFMEELGSKYFREQASSIYIVCKKANSKGEQ